MSDQVASLTAFLKKSSTEIGVDVYQHEKCKKVIEKQSI